MHARTSENAVGLARRLLGHPRRRDQVFGRGMLNDIQWDMLLRLLVADEDGEPVTLPELQIGSGAAIRDAARMVAQLIDQGLIWIVATPTDAAAQVALTSLARTRALRVLIGHDGVWGDAEGALDQKL